MSTSLVALALIACTPSPKDDDTGDPTDDTGNDRLIFDAIEIEEHVHRGKNPLPGDRCLLAAAVDTAGVAIGWQQGRSGTTLESSPQDCMHDDVHYYIGVELVQKLDSSYAVNVRALDLEDRNWVTGFGKRWRGNLNTSQRQAMRLERVDQTFLGARDVPFTVGQTDLLAAHLAHALSCTLKKRVEDDYVVSVDLVEPPANGLEGTVELISSLAPRVVAS